MLQSKLFYKTSKEAPSDAEAISHKLLVRAGFIDQLMAGVFSFLPLGFRVLKNIEKIIRNNIELIGGQEILMPSLNPKENWEKSGRWTDLDVLFKLKGAGDKDIALAATHEEVVVPLAKKFVFSYRDLPLYLFQIQNKFRNELRAKSGILRAREFIMKDLYSFHASQEDLESYYAKAIKAYVKIFKECGIGKETFLTSASGGTFSKYSHEFQTVTDAGEDIIYICAKCKMAINKEIRPANPVCPNCGSDNFEEKKAVEVGNIFKLGTKYSQPFDLKFKDHDGSEKPVIMGCYGLGLGRILGTIAEVKHDERGIIWPESVAPFSIHIIPIENTPKVRKASNKIYNILQEKNIEVLYDDRNDKTAGEKFADADLIGIPLRIVVSERMLKTNSIEVKKRNSKKAEIVKIAKSQKLILAR